MVKFSRPWALRREEKVLSSVISFDWPGGHELGHADIDAQHGRMFLLAQRLVDSLIEKGGNEVEVDAQRLQALIDFTEEHFAFEEGLMRSSGYPGTAWHAKYHASLLLELRTFFRRVHGGQIYNAVVLVKYLRDWLHQHIDTVDRELVVWLSDRKI
jgi:hemerythrin